MQPRVTPGARGSHASDVIRKSPAPACPANKPTDQQTSRHHPAPTRFHSFHAPWGQTRGVRGDRKRACEPSGRRMHRGSRGCPGDPGDAGAMDRTLRLVGRGVGYSGAPGGMWDVGVEVAFVGGLGGGRGGGGVLGRRRRRGVAGRERVGRVVPVRLCLTSIFPCSLGCRFQGSLLTSNLVQRRGPYREGPHL